VLVVAGLHVGALAFFLYWIGRKLRLSRSATMAFTLTLLFAYVAVIEQSAAGVASGDDGGDRSARRLFLPEARRLNSAAIAALVLLWRSRWRWTIPAFNLHFGNRLHRGAGGAVAREKRAAYARALRGWRDVTRDAAHEPRAAQFRIDLRSATRWLSTQLPLRIAVPVENVLAGGIGLYVAGLGIDGADAGAADWMLPLMAGIFIASHWQGQS